MPAPVFPENLDTVFRLAVAGLVGLAVGIERQRSGHATGPGQHFAGTRTFLLIGLLGGLGGLFVTHDAELAGTALVAAGALLTVGAYVATARRGSAHTVDGTTETAALMVLALGLLAGGGALRLASGVGALVVLALAEKRRLHGWVNRLDPVEMRAALQFAVLALVVLPILPSKIPTPLGELTPRATWIFVLIISALNFAGHLARRVAGRERGYAVTGALGGLVSSTAVTWGFARSSREESTLRPAYAAGVIGANTVLFPRLFLVILLLNRDVALEALRHFVAPFIAGVAFTWWAGRSPRSSRSGDGNDGRNPLRLGAALQMAVAFQVVLLVVSFVRARFGDAGIYSSAALFGTTDVDALAVAMSRLSDSSAAAVAARAISVGVASNTLFKLGITAIVGRGLFRARTIAALTVILVALLLTIFLLP